MAVFKIKKFGYEFVNFQKFCSSDFSAGYTYAQFVEIVCWDMVKLKGRPQNLAGPTCTVLVVGRGALTGRQNSNPSGIGCEQNFWSTSRIQSRPMSTTFAEKIVPDNDLRTLFVCVENLTGHYSHVHFVLKLELSILKAY